MKVLEERAILMMALCCIIGIFEAETCLLFDVHREVDWLMTN